MQCLIKFNIVLNSFKKSLGKCFCRAGFGHATGLNSGSRAVTGLDSGVARFLEALVQSFGGGPHKLP